VIVTFAAWLYIAQAVLILGSLLIAPTGWSEGALAVVFAALFGATGHGLLKKQAWGRWLALGSSLLGWTLGSLLLLMLVGYLFFAARAVPYLALVLGAGILSGVALLLLLAIVFWVVSIVVSYRLFWYLCSEDGCEAFGVPPGSKEALLGSTGLWIGMFIVNYFVADGGQSMLQLPGGEAVEVTEAEPAESEEAAEARRAEQEYAERRARDEALLQQQAELEAAQEAASEEEPVAEAAVDAPVVEPVVAEPPVAQTPPDEDEDRSPNRILKCLDASGGTIYTQGYCPAGSKPVRMP
jgi:hypothetical protein